MSARVLRFPDGTPMIWLATATPGVLVSSRVIHQRFGVGTVIEVDGNKLTVDFDHAGRKRVVDTFVRMTAGAR